MCLANKTKKPLNKYIKKKTLYYEEKKKTKTIVGIILLKHKTNN